MSEYFRMPTSNNGREIVKTKTMVDRVNHGLRYFQGTHFFGSDIWGNFRIIDPVDPERSQENDRSVSIRRTFIDRSL